MFINIFKRKKKEILSLDELLSVELNVKNKLFERYGWPISKDVVREQMNLDIQTLDLSPDIEAILQPSCSEEKNGEILVNRLYEDDGEFEYMHEVIHYIIDIGVGKKVDKEFRRKHSENSSDAHEREIDSTAAATLIPIFLLLHDIDRYRKNIWLTDEVAFMQELREKYSCSQACLEKRFKEVHRLKKDKHRLNMLRTEYEKKKDILKQVM